MNRIVVNPWQWSVQMGFNQGEVVEGAGRVLYCAGQTSVDENGTPQHPGDMGAQVSLASTTSKPCCVKRAWNSPTWCG